MSGTVDASIPLQAKTPQQPNPLQTIGEFANLQNTLNQNKLFPGQFQQQGIATQSQQLALQKARNAAAYQAVLPVVANPNFTLSDLTGSAGNAEHSLGIVTQPLIADVAGLKLTPNTPEWRQAVKNIVVSRSQTDPGNAVSVITPDAGPLLNTGPALVPTVKAPLGSLNSGQIQSYGVAIPNGPSPAERNVLQQVWNPTTKQFDYVPRQNVAPMVDGAGSPIGPGAASVPGLPSVGRNQPPPSGGGSAASAPLGTSEEIAAAAEHAGRARERANNYQSTIFPIEGAIDALSKADTGKGGEILQSIRAYAGDTPLKYITDFLPASLSDQDKRIAYDEAQKFTTGMALGGPGGSRSDLGTETSKEANPNLHISNPAAIAISKSILAQRRMEQAGILTFNHAKDANGNPLPVGQYDQFMNDWATRQDPRAYAVDKMSDDDRAALVAKMGGTKSPAYQKFKASVQAAINTGVIPNPVGSPQ
jgi:hypothetical protein